MKKENFTHIIEIEFNETYKTLSLPLKIIDSPDNEDYYSFYIGGLNTNIDTTDKNEENYLSELADVIITVINYWIVRDMQDDKRIDKNIRDIMDGMTTQLTLKSVAIDTLLFVL